MNRKSERIYKRILAAISAIIIILFIYFVLTDISDNGTITGRSFAIPMALAVVAAIAQAAENICITLSDMQDEKSDGDGL